MDEEQIIKMFTDILADKMPGRVLNIEKNTVNNYRNRKLPSLGTMMDLLFKAGLIEITANEPERGTQQDQGGNN